VVVRDSIVAPELGTQTNPMIVGDDPALLSSASNPIVIYINECCCRDETDQFYSDADTEIMATLEFSGTWTDGNLAAPGNKGAAIDSSSVLTRSLCEDPESLQLFEQLTSHCLQSAQKSLKVTEHSFDGCLRFGISRRETVASDHRVRSDNDYL
jgi:hypothetical protein